MDSPYNTWADLKHHITYKFLGLCFLLGAITGSTGDFVHIITQTDRYPHDGPFPFLPFLPVKMPVWVPFLFGSAVVVMGVTHKLFSLSYQPRMVHHRLFVTFAPAVFLGFYALSGFIHAGTGGWQDVWLCLSAIAFWWFADRTKTGALLAFVCAAGGTLFEIFLVSIHGFSYYPQHSNLFGVPSWLPWLYVDASIAVSLVVRWL